MERSEAVLARLDIVRLNDRVLDRAGRMKPLELRSLDAIHLATADLVTTRGAAHVVTYDQRMADAAREFGDAGSGGVEPSSSRRHGAPNSRLTAVSES